MMYIYVYFFVKWGGFCYGSNGLSEENLGRVSGGVGKGICACEIRNGKLLTYTFTDVDNASRVVNEDPDMYFGVFDDDSHLVAMSPTFEGAQFLAQQKGLDANYMSQARLQEIYYKDIRFGG